MAVGTTNGSNDLHERYIKTAVVPLFTDQRPYSTIHLLIRGSLREFSGSLSTKANCRTEKARRRVMTKEILSPDSGGIKN